jgi:hypothetical protein
MRHSVPLIYPSLLRSISGWRLLAESPEALLADQQASAVATAIGPMPAMSAALIGLRIVPFSDELARPRVA